MFRLCDECLEELASAKELRDPRAGALATFEGWVRNSNDGRAVRFLEYQAYGALAEKEGERIIQEALDKYDIIAVRCFHRVGKVQIGQCAVWIGVTAEHRSEALAGCRYVIDQLKQRLPIWKKEAYVEGDSAWVVGEHPVADTSRQTEA